MLSGLRDRETWGRENFGGLGRQNELPSDLSRAQRAYRTPPALKLTMHLPPTPAPTEMAGPPNRLLESSLIVCLWEGGIFKPNAHVAASIFHCPSQPPLKQPIEGSLVHLLQQGDNAMFDSIYTPSLTSALGSESLSLNGIWHPELAGPGPGKVGPGLNTAGPNGDRTPSAMNDVCTCTTGNCTENSDDNVPPGPQH